jgi:hypothetical protein
MVKVSAVKKKIWKDFKDESTWRIIRDEFDK